MMKIFRLVREYLLRQKLNLGLFIALSFIAWILSVSLPYLTGRYVDILINIKDKNSIFSFTKIIACILLIDVFLIYFKSIVVVKLKTRASFELNFDIIEHIKKLPLPYFNNINAAYLNQRVNQDSCSVTFFIVDSAVSIIINLLTFLAIAIFTFTVNRTVALFLFALVPVYALVYFLLRGPMYKKEYRYKENQNSFFSKMNEQLFKIKLIKVNSWFDVLAGELKKSFAPLFRSAVDYTKTMSLYSGASKSISHLAKILMFLFGGLEVLNNRMSIGEFTAINAYFHMLLDCTMYFVNLGKSYQESLVSYVRLKELMDMKLEPNGQREISSIDEIEFRDVYFSFDNRKYILDGFNYKFKKGNIYCVVGRNGIGKSTLIDLMTGLLTNYNGEILYNSLNIKSLNLYSLRQNLIGITEQEPTLFNDSILKNLTYGLKGYDTETIDKICREINIKDFVSSLPDGLNSNISEKAANISGGEKQKLSLARVLLKDSDVLVFDEPTSAMDHRSMSAFKNMLNGLKNDKIIVIVTHTDSILDIADEVIDFEGIQVSPMVM